MLFRKLKQSLLLLLMTLLLLFLPTPIKASNNILLNPGFELGSLTNWTLIGTNCYANSGSTCGTITTSSHTGTYGYITSYQTSNLHQTVDLSDVGYADAYMETQPEIVVGAWIHGISNSTYSLKVLLKDESNNTLVTYNTGNLVAPATWSEVTHTFNSYGIGVRKIYIELTGKDSLYWAGYYGTIFDDIYVNIQPDSMYTLTYTATAGGSLLGNPSQSIASGSNGTSVEAIPDEGYHFVKWSDESTINPRTDNNITQDLEIEAIFEPNEYVIVFDTQGGSTMTSIVGVYQELVQLTQEPTKTGYDFLYWATEVDGSGDIYQVYDSVTLPLDGIILHAQWRIKTFTLKYLSGSGGTLLGNINQSVQYGSSGSQIEAKSLVGYNFLKWSDNTKTNPRVDTAVDRDIFVSALFSLKKYSVVYKPGIYGYIQGERTQTISHGLNASKVTVIPYAGYQFLNWSDGVVSNPRWDISVTTPISVTALYQPLPTTIIDTFEEAELLSEPEKEEVQVEEEVNPVVTETKKYKAKITQKSNIKELSEFRVRVLDSNNQPLKNVEVTIHSEPKTAITDVNGIAVFSGVPAGNHNVAINYSSKEYSMEITIDEPKGSNGEEVELEVVNIKLDEGVQLKEIEDKYSEGIWRYFLIPTILVALILIFGFFLKKKKVYSSDI